MKIVVRIKWDQKPVPFQAAKYIQKSIIFIDHKPTVFDAYIQRRF